MSFREFLEQKLKDNPDKLYVDFDDDDDLDRSLDKDDDDEIDDEVEDLMCYCYGLDDEELEESELPPMLKRKQNRVKRELITKLTDGQFFNWNMRDRARWLSKWEFHALPGGKGKFIKRQKPIDPSVLFKKLKKAAKVMRLNKKIRKAGERKRKITKGVN